MSCVAEGPEGSMELEKDLEYEGSKLEADTGTSTGLLGRSLASMCSILELCVPMCESPL